MCLSNMSDTAPNALQLLLLLLLLCVSKSLLHIAKVFSYNEFPVMVWQREVS